MEGSAFEQAALWRRLDTPGHDACVVQRSSRGWRLSGRAVFLLDHSPCQLSYEVDCDTDWHSRTAKVEGWIGGDQVKVSITTLPEDRWSLNGVEQPFVAGCIDVDLGFTPATNLIALRRLDLANRPNGRSASGMVAVPRPAARTVGTDVSPRWAAAVQLPGA